MDRGDVERAASQFTPEVQDSLRLINTFICDCALYANRSGFQPDGKAYQAMENALEATRSFVQLAVAVILKYSHDDSFCQRTLSRVAKTTTIMVENWYDEFPEVLQPVSF